MKKINIILSAAFLLLLCACGPKKPKHWTITVTSYGVDNRITVSFYHCTNIGSKNGVLYFTPGVRTNVPTNERGTVTFQEEKE